MPARPSFRCCRTLQAGLPAGLWAATSWSQGAARAAGEVLESIERIVGAIGITNLGLIKAEQHKVRELALDGVMLSLDTLVAGQYRLTRSVNLVTLHAEAHARAFMVSQRIASNPPLWRFEGQRLEEYVLKSLQADGAEDHRAIADAQGPVLVANGPASALACGAPAPEPVRQRPRGRLGGAAAFPAR